MCPRMVMLRGQAWRRHVAGSKRERVKSDAHVTVINTKQKDLKFDDSSTSRFKRGAYDKMLLPYVIHLSLTLDCVVSYYINSFTARSGYKKSVMSAWTINCK